MKRLILILLTAVPALGFAQKDTLGLNLPIQEGKVVYEGIIEVPGKSKDEIYKNLRQWFVDYFKNAKAVIQNEDKEVGRISGKGIVPIYWKFSIGSGMYPNQMTIQLDVKDSKYKYKIYDMLLSTQAEYLRGFNVILSAREFTPEDLIGNLTGARNKVLTKAASRNTLEAIDKNTKEVISSLNKAAKSQSDF